MTDIISTQPGSTPIPQPVPAGKPNSVMPSPGKSKKRMVIMLVVALIILIPLLVFGINKFVHRDTLLATVGDQKIYLSTVRAAAEEKYLPSAISNTVLKNFYNIVVERDILDLTAQQLHINITDEQISTEIAKNNLKSSDTSSTDVERTNAKYTLLKNAILAKQIKNVTDYSVGYSMPSFEYPQKPEYAIERVDGVKSLSDIQTEFQAGKDAFDIAIDIASKYPTLQKILNVNGRIFQPSIGKAFYADPENLPLKNEAQNQHYYNQDLYNTLLTIKKGDIKKVIMTDGGGGVVLKATSVVGQGYASYADFLSAKEKELVKVYKAL